MVSSTSCNIQHYVDSIICFFNSPFQLCFHFLYSSVSSEIICDSPIFPVHYPSVPLCSRLHPLPPFNLLHPCLSNSFQVNIQTFVGSHLETAFRSGWVSGSFHTSRLINLQASQARQRAAGEVSGGGGGGRTDRGLMGWILEGNGDEEGGFEG